MEPRVFSIKHSMFPGINSAVTGLFDSLACYTSWDQSRQREIIQVRGFLRISHAVYLGSVMANDRTVRLELNKIKNYKKNHHLSHCNDN